MNPTLFLMVTFFGFMAIRVPVAFAIGGSTLLTMFAYGLPMGLIASRVVDGVNAWVWVAIPLFVMLGSVMNEGDVTERLVDFSRSVVGHIRGGLSHVNVLVNVILAGCSGSIVGDAAGTGKLLIPSMIKERYSPGYSACLTAIAGCIGAIIPPSINAIIVGAVGQMSILRLYIGGIVPGIIFGLSLMAAGYVVSKRRNFGNKRPRATLKEVGHSTKKASLALALPGIFLLGMYAGLFTATEAAACGLLYVVVLGSCVYRQLGLQSLLGAAWEAGKVAGGILWVISMGIMFGMVTNLIQADALAKDFVQGITQNKYVFLFGVEILLAIMGCFMEISAIIMIVLPMTLPIVKTLGIDPIFYGVMFNAIVTFGASTPPFGVTMFVTCHIAGCPIEEYVRDGWPLWVAICVGFIILTLFPGLSTWLPELLLGPAK